MYLTVKNKTAFIVETPQIWYNKSKTADHFPKYEVLMFSQGFPKEFLLLFTILIWAIYLLVLASSPKNKVNQWCCICGFLLSIGVLKEYISMDGFFNSVMTAVLYYLSMPCVVILSMYFSNLNKRKPRLFSFLCFLAFVPAFCFTIIYPWGRTREIAVENPRAFCIVAIYNLSYGLIATLPMLVTLYKERKSPQFPQLRLMSVIGLLPLWYWLITLFLFHLLKLEKLYKLWQGNAFILLFIFIYYVMHLFRGGIWGLRLTREYFDWTENPAMLPKNALYIIHMLKGETAKISWCTHSIREMDVSQAEEELAIIDRSIGHINELIRRTNLYSKEITVNPEPVDVRLLFREASEEWAEKWHGEIIVHADDDAPLLYCDFHHIKETLQNLISNAVDAMDDGGILTLSYQVFRKKIALIQVTDTGCGLTRQETAHIFQPFYTGKSDMTHLGLGLSYCQKVASAHKGYIRVESRTIAPSGTTFTICLPVHHKRKGIKQEHGTFD